MGISRGGNLCFLSTHYMKHRPWSDPYAKNSFGKLLRFAIYYQTLIPITMPHAFSE